VNLKIVIIGTIVKDRIRFMDGSERLSWGGLLYSISALLSLMDESDKLIPVSYAGEEAWDVLSRLSRRDQRLKLEGLVRTELENNQVVLHYRDESERDEYSLQPFPELQYDHILKFSDANIIFVNMISGWDVSLDALCELRRRSSALIALDLHSLTLGRAEDGLRYWKKFNAAQWIEQSDITQCNKNEFQALGGDIENPHIFYEQSCIKGHQVVNLTLSYRGSLTMKGGDQGISIFHIEAPAEIGVVDPTGCGDAFLAAFTLEYFYTRDVRKAAGRANLVAGLSGTFKGLPEPDQLRAKLNRILSEAE